MIIVGGILGGLVLIGYGLTLISESIEEIREMEQEEKMEARRELAEMPFDKMFQVNGNQEFCHATGDEVMIDGEWWNEYETSDGSFEYGR